MTCQDARQIISAIAIENDKLIALNCVKSWKMYTFYRSLIDSQTKLGEEYILSTFPFEGHKCQALNILRTVSSFVGDKIPAGGHQGYEALGGLYTQARPLLPNLYGSIASQCEQLPGHGLIHIPPHVQPGVVLSIYTGHPSYAYPPDRSYVKDQGYPGPAEYQLREADVRTYSSGALPLSNHSGTPYPTGCMPKRNV